eukprot:2521779-Prymnesium_polylepis.1
MPHSTAAAAGVWVARTGPHAAGAAFRCCHAAGERHACRHLCCRPLPLRCRRHQSRHPLRPSPHRRARGAHSVRVNVVT